MRAPLGFVLPDGSHAVSGGNLYNARLAAALAARHPLELFDWAGWVAALSARRPGVYLLDTLDLARLHALAAPALAEQRRVLLVHHLHAFEPECDRTSAERELEALACCDAFLATSPWTRDWLIARGHAAERIFTLPPAPPPPSKIPKARAAPLRALLVGNLIPRKGVLELFDALAPELSDQEPLELEVVGRTDLDPGYAEHCRARLREHPRLGRVVRLTGAVPHERIDSHYRRAHLFVSPASFESFGIALQEARAHALPMLVRDGGFASEHVVPGENGSSHASVAELAAELLRLAREPARFAELAERAERLAPPASRSWDDLARELLSALARSGALGLEEPLASSHR